MVLPRFVLPAFNVVFPQATLSGLQGEYNQMAGVIGEATNILIVGGGAVGVELAGIGGAADSLLCGFAAFSGSDTDLFGSVTFRHVQIRIRDPVSACLTL
jgi:hypothetical protein